MSSIFDNCKIHDTKYSLFCLECDKELCLDCLDGHKDHNINKEFKKCRMEYYKKMIQINPKEDNMYFLLGRATEKETEMLDGRCLTKSQLYLECIRLNGVHSYAYYNLSCILPNLTDTIQLLDGTFESGVSLLLKSIGINPNLSNAYHNLAVSLHDEQETVALLNGTVMDKVGLYVKSIDLLPDCPSSYYNLSLILEFRENKEVTLLNGTIISYKQILAKLIELEQNTFAYMSLAESMKPLEQIQIGSSSFNRTQLLIQLLSIEPKNFEVIYIISLYLIKQENIETTSNLEQEVHNFYESRDILSGEPLTLKLLLCKLNKSKGNHFLRILKKLIKLKEDNLRYHILLKSFKDYLLEVRNDQVLLMDYIQILINSLYVKVQPFPQEIFLWMLETFGSMKLQQHSGAHFSFLILFDYFYQQVVQIIQERLPIEFGSETLPSIYLLALSIDSIVFFDNQLQKKTTFIIDKLKPIIPQVEQYSNNIYQIRQLMYQYIYNYTTIGQPDNSLYLLKFNSFLNSSNSFILHELNTQQNNYNLQLHSSYNFNSILIKLIEQNDEMDIEICGSKYNSKDVYLDAITLNRYKSKLYYSLGRLLNDNESVQIPFNSNMYCKKKLYMLSIQLGNCESYVFYYLALLIGSNPKNGVILRYHEKIEFFRYFDLICQSINNDNQNQLNYRYYTTLSFYLLKSIKN